MKPSNYYQTLDLDSYTTVARVDAVARINNERYWQAAVEIRTGDIPSPEIAREELIKNLRRAADLLEQESKRSGKLL